ncbi:hypothetical protein [Hymenobacter chitinivorans]|uniref:Lipoprotein n=1 Tax=Hymenobacter chitinivorans DSM 11115 TaxID=1121954 RepID=A0A2M9BQ29_9BACT|nr:hypothetical protein [Hymenobacter chitinivorans]PJJ60066.1 hypothetical protein CLV45_1491 [Hymenobacter chitinivorans DSM 11115]
MNLRHCLQGSLVALTGVLAGCYSVQAPASILPGPYSATTALPLAGTRIPNLGRYSGPASTVGFRCVCQISFPNRR